MKDFESQDVERIEQHLDAFPFAEYLPEIWNSSYTYQDAYGMSFSEAIVLPYFQIAVFHIIESEGYDVDDKDFYDFLPFIGKILKSREISWLLYRTYEKMIDIFRYQHIPEKDKPEKLEVADAFELMVQFYYNARHSAR